MRAATTALASLPTNLPNIAHAKLPEAYLAARAAIASAARVDECKTWADKSAALASYAKQANDETLYRHAIRIRARAIDRAGDLLKEIKRDKPGPKRELVTGAGNQLTTRKAVAKAAGLSPRQVATALQVHAFADADPEGFEAAVEGDEPATVTELAKRGTKAKPKPLVDLKGRSPEDFLAATKGMGALRAIAEAAGEIDVEAVVRGCADHERAKMVANAKKGIAWIERLLAGLEK